MRKTAVLLTFLVLAGLLLSASITGVRTDKNHYSIGDKVTIYWNISPDIDPNRVVKLALLDSNRVYYCTIATGVRAGVGQQGYVWEIKPQCFRDNGQAMDIKDGRYAIKVRLQRTEVMGISEFFTIGEAEEEAPPTFRDEEGWETFYSVILVPYIGEGSTIEPIEKRSSPDRVEYEFSVRSFKENIRIPIEVDLLNRINASRRANLCITYQRSKSRVNGRFRIIPAHPYNPVVLGPRQSRRVKVMTLLLLAEQCRAYSYSGELIFNFKVSYKTRPCRDRSDLGSYAKPVELILKIKVPEDACQ